MKNKLEEKRFAAAAFLTFPRTHTLPPQPPNTKMSAFSVLSSAPVNTVRAARVNTTSARRSAVVVRAAGEEPATPAAAATPEPPAPPPPPPKPVTFGPADVFAFSAPKGAVAIASGPELMNGRLAMMAFLSAAGAEIATGKTVVEQVAISPVGIALLVGGIVGGTLVTFCANIKPPANTPGPLTNDVELLNGRAAMVGFAALLAFEAASGHALL